MSTAAILAFSSALVGIAIALIVVVRERRSMAWWFFLAGMGLLVAESAVSGFLAQAIRNYSAVSAFAITSELMVLQEKIRFWENLRLALAAWLPGFWVLFSITFARGNARENLAKWGMMLGAFFVILTGLAVLPLLRGGGLTLGAAPMVDNMDDWFFPLTIPGRAAALAELLGAIFVLMQLERTFWAAVGTMRWRIKYLILGLGVLFAVQVYTSSQALLQAGKFVMDGRETLLPGPEFSSAEVDCGALLLGGLLMLRSLFRGPWDVAVYPAQKGLHKSVAVLASGVYLLAVGVFAQVVRLLGLKESFEFRAFMILVVLVLVTVLLVSDRVQLYVRRLASRYLQRPLYDYRTVWRQFTEGTTSRVTEKELCEASVKLAADIFNALSVSIWLVDETQENLVLMASTSLSAAMAAKLQPDRAESGEVIAAMRERAEPVDVETSKETWAQSVRRIHPSEFAKGGSRVCVPMIAAGELRGIMILGDRVAGVFFSLQDFDLLKCVGDQLAAGLLNSQLSQKLLQAKELEAFQTMSAFFVHDLKNTASTLNLMLKNLPVHFDNPEFRADALRGIAKSGQHINNLIGRLSLLRHDLQIRPVDADLNEVVKRVLASWDGAETIRLVKELGTLPATPIDPDQIHSVVTNLVLNASQAVKQNGEIRVQTSQDNGWVVLTVADNGCGMDPEFLNRSLFRPFKTTKKDGFGIGMFQSKMIVEAHGGRVEVESELNKGTTFRVLLPVRKSIQ